MQPTTTDYNQIFTQLVKKQILILGPDITLAKARNVTGITVDNDGEVTNIEGDPQVLLQSLIDQFVELSGMIVKKTMESILPSFSAASPAAVSDTAVSSTSAIEEPQKSVMPVDSLPKPEIGLTPTLPDDKPVIAAPVEPPPMADVSMASLTPNASTEPKKVDSDPTSFSEDEMANLNKALEDLTKAPLSTETVPNPASNASTV